MVVHCLFGIKLNLHLQLFTQYQENNQNWVHSVNCTWPIVLTSHTYGISVWWNAQAYKIELSMESWLKMKQIWV